MRKMIFGFVVLGSMATASAVPNSSPLAELIKLFHTCLLDNDGSLGDMEKKSRDLDKNLDRGKWHGPIVKWVNTPEGGLKLYVSSEVEDACNTDSSHDNSENSEGPLLRLEKENIAKLPEKVNYRDDEECSSNTLDDKNSDKCATSGKLNRIGLEERVAAAEEIPTGCEYYAGSLSSSPLRFRKLGHGDSFAHMRGDDNKIGNKEGFRCVKDEYCGDKQRRGQFGGRHEFNWRRESPREDIRDIKDMLHEQVRCLKHIEKMLEYRLFFTGAKYKKKKIKD